MKNDLLTSPADTQEDIKKKKNVLLSALKRDKGEGKAALSAYTQNCATKSQGQSGGLIGGFSFHCEIFLLFTSGMII